MTLRSRDIVSASDGDVSFATAGKWLKSENPSVAVKYALRYFAVKLGSAGIFEPKIGQKISLTDTIKNPTVFKSPRRYAMEKTEWEAASNIQDQKIPAKKQAHLSKYGLNTMDPEMTRRYKAAGEGFWILYCKVNKYKLLKDQEDCELVTEEGTFVLEDFKVR